MSNSAKEITECTNALTALIAALHNVMEKHPDLKAYLLPATIRLGEALPCVSSFLNMDLEKINLRLTEVENKLSLLEVDIAQLKSDVAQLKVDVAQLKTDVAQIKVALAHLGDEVTELKVAVAKIDGRLDAFATKEDLYKQTWLTYGAMTALVAAVYFIPR